MRITIAELRRALDGRQLSEADVDHGLYVRPEGARGEHVVEYPIGSGNEVRVGSALQGQTFKPGTAVPLASHTGDSRKLIVGGPPSGLRGLSSFPPNVAPPGELDSIGIISAAPSTVESGAASEAVVLTGFGFRTSDTFEAVRLTSSGWAVDPLITVATTSVPDAETANVAVAVSSSAPVGYSISFRVVGRSAVGADLMSVTAAGLACPTSSITGKSYLGAYFDSGTLYAYDYDDHAYVAEIANKAHAYGSSVIWTARGESGGNEYLTGKGKSAGTVKVFSWNLATNALSEIDTGYTGFASEVIGPVINGTTLYYAVTSSGGNTVTLHSAALGSTSPATVGSLSDAAINWSVQPRSIATMGSSVLVQGYEAGASAGSRAVWSNVGTSTKRVVSFHEDRRWSRDGRKIGSTAIGWGLWAADDELQSLSAAGVMTTLGGIGVWADLDADFDVSPGGGEVVWYPQTSGVDFGTLFRVEIKDWTSLSGCSVVGTDTVEDIPAQFSPPDAMFARD